MKNHGGALKHYQENNGNQIYIYIIIYIIIYIYNYIYIYSIGIYGNPEGFTKNKKGLVVSKSMGKPPGDFPMVSRR